jgi:hypothetical protein
MTRTRATFFRLLEARDSHVESSQNVRGWCVVLATEQPVGTVADLIIDAATTEVLYLAITVDAKVAGRERHVLAPVECCRIDIANEVVVLSGMTLAQMATLPESDPDTLPADYDNAYRSRLSNAYPPKRTTRAASELRIRRRLA